MNPSFSKQSLDDTFTEILAKSERDPLSVDELSSLLSGKGYPFLLLILSLPFCQPLQIPGFSAPFGLMIGFIGLRMCLNNRFRWLPKFVANKKIPHEVLSKIIKKGIWFHKKLKKFVYPRLVWISRNPILQSINGALIALMGFVLALPLPIPLSNLVAGWSICLISLGIIEDDGAFIIAGYVMSGLALIFLIAILLFFQWLIK